MPKNAFMAKQKELQRAFFDAGVEMGRQQIIDMLCLVLHDPDIMGKDIFGKGRLLKIMQGIQSKIELYQDAWRKCDEADYMQSELDAALADAFGEEELEDSFFKRYEFSPEFDYKKGKWTG